MEIVKIFIPEHLFRSTSDCQLFGDVRIHKASASVYISNSKPSETASLIGCISSCRESHSTQTPELKSFVSFHYFNQANQSSITNIHLNSIVLSGTPIPNNTRFQIITFDRSHLLSISRVDVSSERRTFDDEFTELLNVLRCPSADSSLSSWIPKAWASDKKPVPAIKSTVRSIWSGLLASQFSVVRHTAVFQHIVGRQLMLKRLDRKIMCTIAMDMLLGIVVMLVLLHARQPYSQLTNYTEIVVIRLRSLLNALKGFPIGLKLNIELNNFFLGIFTYHINLWVTFLVLIAPVINCMFVPCVILGTLGLSFHLAILSDLLVFISLHAHCFYIYVAVLYHIEIVAINSLWRVLLGKRLNPLKDRVESHEYSNPQLYLATMFFAALLFLMPTLLMYYVIFAFLRFCVYCVTYVLISIQRKIMTFPVYSLACRMMRLCVNTSNIELCLPVVDRSPNPHFPYAVSYVSIRCHSSSAEDDQINRFCSELPEMLSVFQFFMGLVKGNVMAFILPIGKAEKQT